MATSLLAALVVASACSAQDGAGPPAPPGSGGGSDTHLPTQDALGLCEGCAQDEHCAAGSCVPDVCLQGRSTCASMTERKLCDAEGRSESLEPCDEGQVCELGTCLEPVCDPAGVAECQGPERRVCNSLGTEWTLLPCPAGHGCVEGGCVELQANVILLVDTSGSMSWLAGTEELPVPCDLPGDCVPWAFPSCDDPDAPATRLGLVKKALATVLTSEAAEPHRFALQRFPQTGLGPFDGAPTCESGYNAPVSKATGDLDEHLSDWSWLGGVLWQVFAVPFDETSKTPTGELLAWLDFTEAVEPSGTSCTTGAECTAGACIDKECHGVVDPELRGVGDSPLGRSLFYAGEYLRHFVAVEGRSCAGEAGCGSPHHTCVDGQCHDPNHACRPHVIIVLSDGGETVDDDPTSFFHPRVQAKRLHYGLGCHTSVDCLHGATCEESLCVPPVEGLDGIADLEALGVAYDDPEGADVLRDPAGNPIGVTVHVIDAAPEDLGDPLVPRLGGGEHVPVNVEDIEAVVEGFTPLLDIKLATGCP